jgi:hypothetical protein
MEVPGRYTRSREVTRGHDLPANPRLAHIKSLPRVPLRALPDVPVSYPRAVVSSQNRQLSLTLGVSRSKVSRSRSCRCASPERVYDQADPGRLQGGSAHPFLTTSLKPPRLGSGCTRAYVPIGMTAGRIDVLSSGIWAPAVAGATAHAAATAKIASGGCFKSVGRFVFILNLHPCGNKMDRA